MTLQEYQQTPETVRPQELVFGVMRVADAPFVSHQRVVFRLARALQAHAEERGLGEVLVAPVDVVLDRERGLVLQPDLLFVSRDRADIVLDRVDGPPDLIVEVLSPHPRIGSLDERLRWFAAYGVREIWVYHQPERRLDVLECDGGTVVRLASFDRHVSVRSRVLPDFDRTMASVVE